MNAPLIFLSQTEVQKCGGGDMENAISVMEKVFSLHQKGDYILPDKTVLRWGDVESESVTGRINGMPGYIGGDYKTSGIKWISSNPKNPFERNLPRAAGIIILNNPETYFPMAVMDGTLISAMRTAANNGLAAKYLANEDSEEIGLIGAGVLNRYVLRALSVVLPNIKKVKVYDLDIKRAEQYVEEMSKILPNLNISVSDTAKKTVENSDVFVTATVTKEPIVKSEWVKEGSLYLQVGPHEAEYDVIFNAEKIVVDDWGKIKSRGNKTLSHMYNEGLIEDDIINCELGEIVNQLKIGRESKNETIYFNSVGMGIQDIVLAREVYQTAKTKGIGKSLDLWE